jgi:N-acetylmuramoyl-L-alanine amidase
MRFARLSLALAVAAAACSGAVDGDTTTPVIPPVSTNVTTAPPTTTTTTPITMTTSTISTTTTIVPTTTTGVTAPGPLAGRTVVLDPGHNGENRSHPDEINRLVDIGNGTKACNTTGTATDDGYPEPRFTWEVAILARAELERLGATVVLTRSDNDGWGPCIDERAAIGNQSGADAVISIHADGGPAGGRGFHIIRPSSIPGLTDDIAGPSARLAEVLHEAMRATDMPVADYIGDNGYSVRDDLGGLNLSDVPTVFLEAGNMRNAVDAGLLTDPAHQQRIAEAIAAAVVAYLG